MNILNFGKKHPILSIILRHEVFFLILFAIIFLRIPNLFEPYWYGDEGIYLTLGLAVQKGLVIYRDIIDHKTPIIYYLAAVPSQFWFKFVLIGWMLATTGALYKLALRLTRSIEQSSLAVLVFALLTTLPPFEGNIANGELFVMGFVIVAMWLFSTTELWKSFVAKTTQFRIQPLQMAGVGALLSLGALTKVPAVFDAVTLAAIPFFMLIVQGKKFPWMKHILSYAAMGVGFFIPLLLSVAFFASQGGLQAYFDIGWLYNFHYTTTFSFPFSNPVLVFLFGSLGKTLFVGASVVLLGLFHKKISPQVQFASTWLFFTLYATLLSSRPYPHYWLQVFPAAALLVGFLLNKALKWEKLLFAGQIALFIFILLLFKVGLYPTVSYYQNFISYVKGEKSTEDYRQHFNPLMRDTYEAATYIQQHTTPDERIFIWGTNPMLYALAERVPAGRFTVSFHIKDFGGGAYEETMRDITKHEPKYIVVMEAEDGKFDEFYTYLMEHYVPARRLEHMTIYTRLGNVE